MGIGGKHRLPPRKGTDKHKQRRLRQMEVSKQARNNPKLMPRPVKDAVLPRVRVKPEAGMRLKRSSAGQVRTMLQRPRSSGSRCDDAPPFAKRSIDSLSRSSRQRVMFGVKMNVFNVFRAHRLKGPKPNVKCNALNLDPALAKLSKDLAG